MPSPLTHEDFLDWRRANPAVWDQFVALCDEAWASGRRRWSARAAFHIIRWSRGTDINNLLSAHMARAYLAIRPDRPDFFELRCSDAGEAPKAQLRLDLGQAL